MTQPFQITYIGGGSKFVTTLLHGLAARRDTFASLGRSITLSLLDIEPARAAPRAQYAQIVARQTGLPITPVVTADAEEALRGARWILFSPGFYQGVRAARERLLGPDLHVSEDSGPGCAIEAALAWPLLCDLGPRIRDLAPDALFSTLVNPTDVLAPAFERRFGIRSIGLCVEVPQLRRWLARQLEVRVDQISLDHIGVNHFGWVTRFMVDGMDAMARLRQSLERGIPDDLYHPHCEAFVQLLRSTGLMRSGAYHLWPFAFAISDEAQDRRQRIRAAGCNHNQHMARQFQESLQTGRMIQDDEQQPLRNYLYPYQYCTTARTLGAMAAALAGAVDVEASPLQVRNGLSNPVLAADAWIEVPTKVMDGRMVPASVAAPPQWALAPLAAIAAQRQRLADWLVTGDQRALCEAMLAWPEPISLDRLMQFVSATHSARHLPPACRGAGLTGQETPVP